MLILGVRQPVTWVCKGLSKPISGKTAGRVPSNPTAPQVEREVDHHALDGQRGSGVFRVSIA